MKDETTIRWWWLGGVAVALLLAAALLINSQASLRAVPPVVFNTIDGETVASERLHGRLTLVNFWATTCGICRQEMPELVRTYERYHARGFDVMAVAMPYDRPDWVMEYVARQRLPFKVAIDFDGKVNEAFGSIRFTPVSFLIDARGKVVREIVGAPDFNELRREIEAQLAGRET